MLQVKCFNSISLIEAIHWDSILSQNEIFNTHDFIEGVEKAKVENASFWYLLFYDGDVLAGHAVLSSFTISLDLFISANQLVHVIKNIGPNFFKARILVCGLPASFGQSNLKAKDDAYAQEIAKLVAKEMEKIAIKENINLLCAKEFKGKESDLYSSFLKSSFFKAYSLPYMKMDVYWDSFTEFLDSMRHPYRRAIKLSLLKAGSERPKIYQSHESFYDSQPVWVLGDITLLSAKDLFEMYLPVMDRTPTKLETLNLSFFENIQYRYKSKMEVLTIQHKGKIVSAGILIQHNQEITFMLVGRKHMRDDVHSYFNLVYGIIELAISRGVQRINLGQTAYWVKQRVGGEPVDVYIYFKSRKKFINWILKRLNNVIFPRLDLKMLSVFHKSIPKESLNKIVNEAYEFRS
jgi:predicted N-acyltransferase